MQRPCRCVFDKNHQLLYISEAFPFFWGTNKHSTGCLMAFLLSAY